MHIVGTAGHVDHGKSSLVIALTGHDPDRFIEEQQRGMTLDLGFAPLRFPDGIEAGIIDVPGHERFLHNMLAGAAGMELLLLVIAAPEGPKRQTFEHLHILNFLNVTRAIIVLTKIDLVDFEDREIAASLAREACEGTVAQEAPVVMVSTVTGEGIEALKSAIHNALVDLAPRRIQAPAYLPVDRVFALPGHGTIVTGTLMQGVVTVGDTLALQPSGIAARVKNLQIFGQRVESASGGSRVAINLPGIDVDQIARGEALVAPREFEPAREFVVDFSAVPSAIPMLRRRTPVRVHIGSAEIPGQLRFEGSPPRDQAIARATLTLQRPTVFYPGQRIIVRRTSPKDLLGGATLLRAAVPGELATSPLASTPSVQPAQEFEDAPAGASEILAVLEGCGLAPLGAAKIAAQSNVGLAVAEPALAWLVEHGRAAALHKPGEFMARNAFDAAFSIVDRLVRSRHAESPWLLGVTAAEVARSLAVREPLAIRLLDAWQDDGRLGLRANAWHAPDFQPKLSADQRDFFERAVTVAPSAPFLPASYEQLSRAAAAHRSSDISQALASLFAVGAFVRVGDDVYRRSQIERAQGAISALIAEHGSATMAQLRDVLGTSRKYALPLMEHFDSIGFTVRDGDLRRLRGKTRSS